MAEYYSSFPIQISPFSPLSSELIPLVYCTPCATYTSTHTFGCSQQSPPEFRPSPPSQLGPSDPAPCDADGYPNYHLSQAKQQMLMAFFPLIVCALFKIGYSLLCRQVMMTTCNYKLAQLRCIVQ
jgi:hypothetical protein